MIISKTIKLDIKFPVSNQEIENQFKLLKLDVLRWAIIKTDKSSITLNISYKNAEEDNFRK